MKNDDYATKDRKAFIKGEASTLDEKFARARAQLGTRYLCHPVNHVQKRIEPKDSPDVAVTFKAAT